MIPTTFGRGKSAAIPFLAVAWGLLLGAWTLDSTLPALGQAGPLERFLWGSKIALETLASFYLISNILKAAAYVCQRRGELLRPAPIPQSRSLPSVGLVYLCCDDLDLKALESLCTVRYPGPLFIIVHDDSRTSDVRERVDRALADLEERHGRPITLLRRPSRRGGKPGAVNYVLERTSWMFQYFVLFDNDSIVLQPDFLPRALALLEDPRTAAVQFRSRGVPDAASGILQRNLARAIDAFDVFMRSYARSGLTPFLGHNAILRTRDVVEAGGLAEGIFSDDIDLTLRLAGRGRRVVYAPSIEVGERHPASYAAFLIRCRKWAYGCMQVLGRHLRPALASRALELREKFWLLEFAGFYLVQALLTPYLLLAYVAIPLTSPPALLPVAQSAAFGALVLAAILAPTLALAIADRRLHEWPAMAWSCALVYGSSVFASTRGVIDYLRAAVREWVPTNQAHSGQGLGRMAAAQAILGAALFGTPLWAAPDLLLAPSSYLFVSIYLFSPLVVLAYRPRPSGAQSRAGPRGRRRRRGAAGGAVLIAAAGGLASLSLAGGVEARQGRLYVDGKPFLVRGIHYSPWLPGTGPMKAYAWPEKNVLQADLRRLLDLGVNTLLVHDAPDAVFDVAESAGLRIIHAFYINWQSLHDERAFAARSAEIAARVAELRNRRHVLLWLLGNEIPEWVVEKHGTERVSGRLSSLYEAVKRADPNHLVSHSNWPPTRELDLDFMDVAAFNLYPLWPREVVVRGYGDYIEQVLKPLARGRPLLITEFGISTLESGEQRQAQILSECWREIERLTSGGVVFEFADEWWKNYDNPIRQGEWWQRRHAPDDEKTHDLDPEEHYGIMTSDRSPRPAYAAVRAMFTRPQEQRADGRLLLVAPLVLLLIYTVYVFWRRV
jgi:GT2 family glycosyltransferase